MWWGLKGFFLKPFKRPKSHARPKIRLSFDERIFLTFYLWSLLCQTKTKTLPI
ncbi:hypothetical protein AO371_1175 [Moraxella catarrhalis]|nr:hypothetical protein AO378_1227 [Moraxella catarrhalis]OAV13544.1 hypothetical protein AO380_0138 [Moraxella catarrhalis]OAV23684.1 hypothetical protein AO371_1175 [Moraxella catarrhalis]OAV31725.1 hypothetical protein AO367_0245 [Moraxella catarrhalis]